MKNSRGVNFDLKKFGCGMRSKTIAEVINNSRIIENINTPMVKDVKLLKTTLANRMGMVTFIELLGHKNKLIVSSDIDLELIIDYSKRRRKDCYINTNTIYIQYTFTEGKHLINPKKDCKSILKFLKEYYKITDSEMDYLLER